MALTTSDHPAAATQALVRENCPLGLLDLLPLELRQQIYNHLHHRDDNDNILRLGLLPNLPDDDALALLNTHPILAGEFFEYTRQTAKCVHGDGLGCTFHASQLNLLPTPWTPTPFITLEKIRRLAIQIHYSADADVTSLECMSQLKTIRTNISRLVDFIQASNIHFTRATVIWDEEFWSGGTVRDIALGRRHFKRALLPDRDECFEPFITYVLAPLRRLEDIPGGLKDDDQTARVKCDSMIERLGLVYLNLKLSLYCQESDDGDAPTWSDWG